jgi:hypothetical protein
MVIQAKTTHGITIHKAFSMVLTRNAKQKLPYQFHRFATSNKCLLY